jgi:hypothetical protein
MTEKEKIKELAIEVNEFLSLYIKIHDEIHREAESFFSVIKNILGLGVPMSKLLKDAKSLIPKCESVKGRMDSFKLNSYSKLSNDEKFYFDMLLNYHNALEKTVNCLVQKQILMEMKSNNPLNKISFKEFKMKDKEYKYLINEYLAFGSQLNNSSQIIFR